MKRNQYLDDMAKFVGLFVIALVVGGLLFGLVYGLIGNLSELGHTPPGDRPGLWLAGGISIGAASGQSPRQRRRARTRPQDWRPRANAANGAAYRNTTHLYAAL